MPIYTKTGDTGKTALIGGRRVSKANEQLEIYGSIDELNAYIGLVLSFSSQWKDSEKALLTEIQQNLFKIGSFYAFDFLSTKAFSLPFILEEDIEKLEKEIDEKEKNLVALHDFILPGGNQLASHLHVARCICRRVERLSTRFSEQCSFFDHDFSIFTDIHRPLNELGLRYLNRLSDTLFIWARYQNEHTKA